MWRRKTLSYLCLDLDFYALDWPGETWTLVMVGGRVISSHAFDAARD